VYNQQRKIFCDFNKPSIYTETSHASDHWFILELILNKHVSDNNELGTKKLYELTNALRLSNAMLSKLSDARTCSTFDLPLFQSMGIPKFS
jgi:hypothetical protein